MKIDEFHQEFKGFGEKAINSLSKSNVFDENQWIPWGVQRFPIKIVRALGDSIYRLTPDQPPPAAVMLLEFH